MKNIKDGLKSLFSKDRPADALLTSVMIASVVVLNVIVFALTAAFGLYIYSPETTDLTISGNTDSLYKGISDGKEVTVTFCLEEEELKAHDTGHYVWQTVRQFEERYSFVKVKYVNMLTKRDESGNLYPLEKYKTDMKGNETPIRQHSVIFSSGDNYRVITDTYSSAGFADFFSLDSKGSAYAYNGEEVVASMIAWVLHDEHGAAYMTQKHGETADISFANMLTCAGYYVDAINLKEKEVPSDASLVVISNPTSDFYRIKDGAGGRSELERLEDYLERGGNLYVTLDPLVKRLPNLEGFLSEWGITLSGVTSEDGKFARSLVRDTSNGITTDGYSFVCDYADSNAAGLVRTLISSYTDGRVLLSGASGLELDESLGAEALLVSSPSASLVAGGETQNRDGSYAIAAYSERLNDDGSYGKLVVVPSIYLTAADALSSDAYTNSDFIYSVFSTLFGADTAPLGCTTVNYSGSALENFTMKTANAMTALVLAIPVLTGIIGTVIIIKRKNR